MPDPAIPPVPRAALPERWRTAADAAEDSRGEATLIEVLGNAPDLLGWYYDSFYQRIFFGGLVPRRDKELLRLRLSSLNGCAYCNRGNTRSAVEGGLTTAQVAAIRNPKADVFDARDRAILAVADAMALANMEGELPPAVRAALAEHFTREQAVELAMVAAVLTGMAKMLFVFDLVSREADCPIGPPVAA